MKESVLTSKRTRLVELGQVIEQDQQYVTELDSRPYQKLSVKLYGKGVVLDTPVDGSTVRMTRHQIARAGQVILSEIWGKKGAIGIVPKEGDGALCTSHFFLFNIDESRIHPDYLQAILSSNFLEEQLGSEARGTTGYAAVRPKHLLAAKIPLPSLDHQIRTVNSLRHITQLLAEAQRLRLESCVLATDLIGSLHLSLSGARSVQMCELLELYEDRAPVCAGEVFPQVGLRGFGQGLFAKESVAAENTTYKHFNRLYSGAIVLSQVKGWEGAIGVCPSAFAGRFASPEYRTFRCISGKASSEYFNLLLQSRYFWGQLKNLTRGMGGRRERTRPEHFLAMNCPFPELEQQLQAVTIFQRLESVRKLQDQSSKELNTVLPSLLDKLFKLQSLDNRLQAVTRSSD